MSSSRPIFTKALPSKKWKPLKHIRLLAFQIFTSLFLETFDFHLIFLEIFTSSLFFKLSACLCFETLPLELWSEPLLKFSVEIFPSHSSATFSQTSCREPCTKHFAFILNLQTGTFNFHWNLSQKPSTGSFCWNLILEALSWKPLSRP